MSQDHWNRRHPIIFPGAITLILVVLLGIFTLAPKVIVTGWSLMAAAKGQSNFIRTDKSLDVKNDSHAPESGQRKSAGEAKDSTSAAATAGNTQIARRIQMGDESTRKRILDERRQYERIVLDGFNKIATFDPFTRIGTRVIHCDNKLISRYTDFSKAPLKQFDFYIVPICMIDEAAVKNALKSAKADPSNSSLKIITIDVRYFDQFLAKKAAGEINRRYYNNSPEISSDQIHLVDSYFPEIIIQDDMGNEATVWRNVGETAATEILGSEGSISLKLTEPELKAFQDGKLRMLLSVAGPAKVTVQNTTSSTIALLFNQNTLEKLHQDGWLQVVQKAKTDVMAERMNAQQLAQWNKDNLKALSEASVKRVITRDQLQILLQESLAIINEVAYIEDTTMTLDASNNELARLGITQIDTSMNQGKALNLPSDIENIQSVVNDIKAITSQKRNSNDKTEGKASVGKVVNGEAKVENGSQSEVNSQLGISGSISVPSSMKLYLLDFKKIYSNVSQQNAKKVATDVIVQYPATPVVITRNVPERVEEIHVRGGEISCSALGVSEEGFRHIAGDGNLGTSSENPTYVTVSVASKIRPESMSTSDMMLTLEINVRVEESGGDHTTFKMTKVLTQKIDTDKPVRFPGGGMEWNSGDVKESITLRPGPLLDFSQKMSEVCKVFRLNAVGGFEISRGRPSRPFGARKRHDNTNDTGDLRLEFEGDVKLEKILEPSGIEASPQTGGSAVFERVNPS